MRRATTASTGTSKATLPSFSTADPVTRRRFLAAAGGGAAGLAFALRPSHDARADVSLKTDPFTLGVASGEPRPHAVLIWTRLAPEPLAVGCGLDPSGSLTVRWEVAADEHFRRIAARGTTRATAAESYSVHVDVDGLQPDRPYWYRFRCRSFISPVGRTRTAPAPDSTPPLRFGFASCMDYRLGYFHAMRDAAEQDLDAMFFLGDYVYEFAIQQMPTGRPIPSDLPAETVPMLETLEQYRLRYGLHKLDPDLQAAHHVMPWVLTWDDHEVADNYETLARDDLDRRAAAYRAYWENMPLRKPQLPQGSDARIYRRIGWGRTAQFDVLDTRQYRDPETKTSPAPDVGERRDPGRTVLGAEQERWLAESLGSHPVRWNFVAQQILMARLNTAASVEQPTTFSPGTWDGYQASQQRMFDLVAANLDAGRVRNFCSLGGDVHCSYVSDLISDSLDPDSDLIGVDITSPSVSTASDFNPVLNEKRQVRRRMNDSLHWADLHCGYDICDVNADRARFDVRVVDKVSDRDSPFFTGASFVVQDRVPGFSVDH
ncbi:alkaline phosphatase D family protein [Microlunatus soli]|uniref:Alkaline phosphatase D n=1 Tax=Microlunatus soli TaxID=630515 RepID=A0A1H1XMY1_9ACTN|nr:alkaline phosphatase D family protein [Microlunatus soli]SDT10543.1 alkaline phosphatase D [Microlunatus soli]